MLSQARRSWHPRQCADWFSFGTHCLYSCYSSDGPTFYIDFITDINWFILWCIPLLFFPSFGSLLGTVWMHGCTDLLSLHWTFLSAGWWVNCTCDSHLASLIAAQIPAVDVSLHSHAMCQTSLHWFYILRCFKYFPVTAPDWPKPKQIYIWQYMEEIN